MASPTYEHFKFDIGDFVQSAFCEINEKANLRRPEDTTFQIIERIYQECPGGVQLHYLCRQMAFMQDQKVIQFNEIELIQMSKDESSETQ